MDKMIIPVHSVVDVITNSSTMIYTGATDEAVSAIRSIINFVLLEAGSDKRVDDLYDVKLVKKSEIVDENAAYDIYVVGRNKWDTESGGKTITGEFTDSGVHAESYVSVEPKEKGATRA